jgi:uncharacterized protein (TIRG00374 family)
MNESLSQDTREKEPAAAPETETVAPETETAAPETETVIPGADGRKPEPGWKKTLKFVLRFGVSAGILTYLICTRDIKWQDFKLVKPSCIIASFFCICIQLSLTGVRWFTLLRAAGVKCSFREAFSLQMQGMFFSQFLPGGSVGGDVVKAGILATRTPPGGKFNVVFSIFVDRLCGLGALLIALLGTCLICHDTIAKFPEGQRDGLLAMCAVCGALLGVVIFVFFSDLLYKVKFFKFFLDIADRITKDTFKRAADAVALYRRRWKLLLGWIVATTLVFFPVLGLPVWLMANGFEGAPHRDFLPCLMISNVSQTIAAIPGSFGGTGTRDIAGAEMMTAMGFSDTESGVIPILVTMVTLLVALSCSVFFIFDRGKREPKA